MNLDINVRNAIVNINNLSSLTINSDNRPRGSSRPVNFNNNGIFITKVGQVLLGSLSSSLTITVEGGNPNWDGAFIQNGVIPYYTNAQVSTLLNIVQFILSINPQISITNNTVLEVV